MPEATDQALIIIERPLASLPAHVVAIRIPVDRLTLAKRRWRGVADDGTEFGFTLEKPLTDGAAVWCQGDTTYVIAQRYEPVLEIELGSDAATAARLGWIIGNLHFPLEIIEGRVRVADDSALRQLFERESLPFTACKRVFRPLGGGHTHGHHHHH
jgi:urease accessory protein